MRLVVASEGFPHGAKTRGLRFLWAKRFTFIYAVCGCGGLGFKFEVASKGRFQCSRLEFGVGMSASDSGRVV